MMTIWPYLRPYAKNQIDKGTFYSQTVKVEAKKRLWFLIYIKIVNLSFKKISLVCFGIFIFIFEVAEGKLRGNNFFHTGE